MADDPWVGTILAERYRIESPYYRTTKAELYRGLDLGTETQIVVHLANGEFSQNSQFTSQFEQEARRLRTLEHPALIPVLEYGRERDRLFMVCPFLPGGSLEQEIRRQWSLERTNEVVERIGEALVYLHGQEMVHRNVSADSIIFDGESRPHLSLGFGRISRAIDPAAGRGSVYVLPEQARLNYVLADPKVDVYAFGVVLWLMLLGQPPYADAPLDKQLIESWQKTELPDTWRAILERAISSDPERRFNSMPEFLTAWRETQNVLINRATLRQTLIRSFDIEEFRNLCFNLNVDFDELSGQSISSKKRELIWHLERRGRLPDLISAIKQLRPQENLNTPLPRISQSKTDTSLVTISDALKNSFSLEEIKDLIFDLNLNYEEYRSSKSALIIDFLAHIEQLDRKNEVVQKIVSVHPNALPIAPHSVRANPIASPQIKSKAGSQTQQRYLESQDAAGQILATEIATKAPRPQTQTTQNASDYDANVAQSDAAATFITGWASTNAVTISGEQARVGSAGINLRAEPRPDAPMIGRAVGGSTLRITGQAQGNYVPVQARQEDMGAAVDLAAAPLNLVGEESANVNGDTGAAEAVMAAQAAWPQDQISQDAIYNAVKVAQDDTDADEVLKLATQAASPQDQTTQDAIEKGVQGDTNAAADITSYPEDPPVQQTSYGDMEQSARPQTLSSEQISNNTPSSLPSDVTQDETLPHLPDVQRFRLLNITATPFWPGQTITINLNILSSGEGTWDTLNGRYIWEAVCGLFDAEGKTQTDQELDLNWPLLRGNEQPRTFKFNAPSQPGTYQLQAYIRVTDSKQNRSQTFNATTLQETEVLDLAQANLDTLLNAPQPLSVSVERSRLRHIGNKLEDTNLSSTQREELVRVPILATWLESGSIREKVTATKALQRLGPLPVTSGTVNDLVEQYLAENAAAIPIAQRLLTARDASQTMKAWLQARLQDSKQLSVTSLQSPVSSLQSPQPPAANGQPPAAPPRPFMLALEQIAHSKPLTHKIVFDITPQRVKLTYGGENYEGPTQLDDTVLRTLALKRREYGMALFNAILHETDRQNQRLTATRNGYDFALREAREGLYLELQLDDTLHELCWENLCDPDGLPVGISDKRALYRRVRANVSKTRIDYGKLRILVMICNPANLGPGSENTLLQNLTPINVAGEKALLEGALLRLKEAGLAEYIIYDGSPGREATLENLRDELEKRDEEAYHILHLVAHGLFDKQKQYRLVMEGTGGKPEALVTATDFQEVLARGELRLAILSACLSATAAASEDDTDDQDAAASPDSVLVLPGLGPQLVREANIPAVIAMQGLLKADTAALFHRYFYDDLARHGRVARALAVTRGAIYDAEKKLPKSGWGVPTLFMGTDDDWLFGLDKRKVKQFDPLAPIPAEAKELLRQGDWHGLRQHIQQNMAQGLAPFAAALPPHSPPTRPLAPAQNRAFLQTTLQPQVRLNPLLLGAEVKKQTGLDINPMVYQQVASALNSGKHILLTGPPGTGKTSLAQAICAYAQSQQFTDDPILTTATADWTTFDTIGGYVPDTQGQLQFRPGIFLRAVRDASWLVIDEMNRAEIDKAFGELFTVLSGQAIELPYSANGQPVRVLPPAKGAEWIPPLDEAFHNVVIFPAWRIIGTMNVYDKSFLFNMSFAFMRRFAFVDVDLPPPNTYQALINRWLVPTELVDESAAAPFVALGWLLVDLVNEETVLMRRRALGPAILKDMIAYVRDRYSYEADAAALLDIFGEAFIMYALPQLDGLDHDSILDIYDYLHRLTSQLSAPMQQTLLKRLKILYPHIRTAEWDNALSNRPK